MYGKDFFISHQRHALVNLFLVSLAAWQVQILFLPWQLLPLVCEVPMPLDLILAHHFLYSYLFLPAHLPNLCRPYYLDALDVFSSTHHPVSAVHDLQAYHFWLFCPILQSL